AIKAIYGEIYQKPKWALDADISKCFDQIDRTALLAKLNTSPRLSRCIRGWLEAGVMDGEELFPTTTGTPQGGVISPLLANIALHGLETVISQKFPKRRGFSPPKVVRYADDFGVLHEERAGVEQSREIVSEWLKEMGLELKASKTRIVHTLETTEGEAGFEFLGFQIRQDPAGKPTSDRNGQGQPIGCGTPIGPTPKAAKQPTEKRRETMKRPRAKKAAKLIEALNPQIAGGSNDSKDGSSHAVFHKLGTVLFAMLYAWAKRRHPNQSKGWIVRKSWRVSGGWRFQSLHSGAQLRRHEETHDPWSVKVAGARSPDDGDWLDWSTRLGDHPKVPPRVASLLNRRKGKGRECSLRFRE